METEHKKDEALNQEQDSEESVNEEPIKNTPQSRADKKSKRAFVRNSKSDFYIMIAKRYARLKVVFFALLLLFGFSIYYNYDYIVFKLMIAYNYIYTDALDKIYKESINQDPHEKYADSFDAAVISVFMERIRQTNGDRYTYLYTPEEYTLQKEVTKSVAAQAEIKELTEKNVYLSLPNISPYTKDFLYENKEKLNTYDNIVIDLRSNHGGTLDDLYNMSDLFLPKGAIIGKEVTRIKWFTKVAKAKEEQFFTFQKILLLQDKESASAAEGFIMSLKENLDNVTIIGAQSFGKGIGQLTLPVKNGFAVKATLIRIETPKGNSIHKIGITPDILYEKEDIVDFAQSIIGS